MIKRVKFFSIPVTDEDRSLEFYTKGLGFEVLTDQSNGEGRRWIELGIPGAETRVVHHPPEDRGTIGTFQGAAFMADDVEGTCREMAKRGVEFVQEAKTESWGTSAIFKDPDGNTFVLGSK
jgi:catechol 2,3-dioxygenase-like lactoylglutathione lyase family enzyme